MVNVTVFPVWARTVMGPLTYFPAKVLSDKEEQVLSAAAPVRAAVAKSPVKAVRNMVQANWRVCFAVVSLVRRWFL